MALSMSLVALSIDSMLPALDSIGQSLGVENKNDQQLIIGFLFIGMAFGQLLFGPLSDSIGRRRSMLIGYLIFLIGSVMSIMANDINYMLFSRFLQGFGVAAPRVLSTAIIRDQYAGREMAKVMSFVLMMFILVPMLAPMFGQLILNLFNWQSIFIAVMLVAIISLCWYLLRQGETLALENRADFTVKRTRDALSTIFKNRRATGFSVTAGIVSAPFVFYLSSSQQLFQISYELAEWFPLFFAGLSLAFGCSSFVSGKFVMTLGMQKLVTAALKLLALISSLFVVVLVFFNGFPPLWITSIYLFFCFFCLGILFGNLNALAMEPLGHLAGIGAAIVGSLGTFISATLAVLIGLQFDGTVYPLTISFAIASLVSLILIGWIDKEKTCAVAA